MKTKMLRSLSISLALIIFLGLFSITASAYDVGEIVRSGDYDYYLQDDGTVRLDAYYGGDENLEIPELIDGHEVSTIGRGGAQWFFNEPVDGVLLHMNTKSIKLPKTVVGFLYNSAISCFGSWITIENIYVDDENPNFKSENGIFYNKDMTKLLFYPEGKQKDEFKVPDSVCVMERGSVRNNNYLERIYIGKQISFIDDDLFRRCPNVTLYVYPDSYGLEWAQSHDFPYVIVEDESEPVEKDLVDEETEIQVSGLMDDDTNLIVSEITDEQGISNANTLLGGTETVKNLYDISLTKDGEKIQHEGMAEVKIPCDNENAKVYRVESDNTLTDMNAVYTDGNLVFHTEHFSLYIVASHSEKIFGDINSDGKVDVTDVTALQNLLAESSDTLNNPELDLNSDGKVDVADVTYLQQFIADTIVKF